MTIKSLALAIVSSLPLLLVACPDPATPPTPPAPPSPPAPPAPDTTAPTIVSLELASAVRGSVKATPGVTARGVDKDANIVITFSEPMNRAATQAAYQSSKEGIRAADVVFAFDASGKVLTINPNKDLDYSSGSKRNEHTFTLTGTATDLSGNALSPETFTFSTLKTSFLGFTSLAKLDGEVTRNGLVVNTNFDVIEVGDFENANDGVTDVRAFVTFDLSRIPASIPSQNIVSASLELFQDDVVGTPYGDLGRMILDHLDYGPALDADDFLKEALSSATGFSDPKKGEYKNTNTFFMKEFMLKAIQDDISNRKVRVNRSQFRLRFEKTVNLDGNGDQVEFLSSEGGFVPDEQPFLFVTFLEP
jgi:Bacterial Ig-like domain